MGLPGWNAVRYDPSRAGGHVESYFFKLNGPEGRRALWLKTTILARPGRDPVAEAWAIAFDREGEHIGVKQVVPYEDARFSREGFDVEVAHVHFSDGHIEGDIEHEGHRIAFSLDFDADGAPLIPFPSLKMYETKLPSSKLVSPHPDTSFTGQFTVDAGEPVLVDGWRGMQGHNWGTRHAELYGWGHVNQWDNDEELLLEGVTARVKLGPVLAPPLTVICVWHRGMRYEFNAPRELLHARGTITPRSWRFSAESRLARVEGELSADTDDFVGLYYENPNGEMTYCLNSKIASGKLRLEVRGRPVLEATTRSAALEIGTKDASHGVRMLV